MKKKIMYICAVLILSVFSIPYSAHSGNAVMKSVKSPYLSHKLFKAVESGNLAEIQQLVGKGANIHGPVISLWFGPRINGQGEYAYEDCTLLHIASARGDTNIVQWLIENGVNVNTREGYGRTPLHCAARYGRIKIIKQLLHSNACVDAPIAPENPGLGYYFHGLTPLHVAATYGHSEAARVLIEHGANVNAFSTIGQTAFGLAKINNHHETADLILRLSVNTNIQSGNIIRSEEQPN